MRILINRNSKTPMYMQIKNQIKNMIFSNIIPEGFSLPAERKLANELGVNRSTVIKAYQELKADGLVESHVGKGTVVIRHRERNSSVSDSHKNPLSWYQFFNETSFAAKNHIIRDIMEATSRKEVISFAGGIPSPDLYPIRTMKEIQNQIYKEEGSYMFFHSPVEGYYPLRESISHLIKTRQISVLPKEIMILSGSQQGLDFISRIFIEKGDIVIVEEPTYMGAIQMFRAQGAKVIGVPIDQHGIRTDILEANLKRLKPKFIYTLPTFQNPSGILMSLERRQELLNLAYKYQVPIVEDDPYGEIRYEGNFVPPLKALDKHNYVIYLSTFSKVLFLGLRVGWVVAPQEVIRKFAYLKQISDLHVNTPSQMILNKFLRQGYYEEHLKVIRKEYLKKRDLMVKALERYKVEDVYWNIPKGGYYIWCRLPRRVSYTKLLNNASRTGVVYLPGEAFYSDGTNGDNFIRLNFTYLNHSQINEGIRRLMKAVKQTLSEACETSKDIEFNKNPIV